MKKVLLAAMLVFAFGLSSVAHATEYSFDYRLNGLQQSGVIENHDRVPTSSSELVNVPLHLSFNTHNKFYETNGPDGDLYYIPANSISLTLGGENLIDSIPFEFFAVSKIFLDSMEELASATMNFRTETWWGAGGETLSAVFELTPLSFSAYYLDYGSSVFDPTDSGVYGMIEGDLSPTPIPGAIWLFGSGLVGLFGLRRKFA